MTVDAHTGEIVEHSTADQARARADRIRGHLTAGYVELIDAWRERDDLALGYVSWDAYCAAEFTEGRMIRLDREQRREIVAGMHAAGMPTREIGSALGIGNKTAARDLTPPVSSDTPPADYDHEMWAEQAERLTANGTVARWDAERPYLLAVVGLRNSAEEITGLGLDPAELGRNVPAVGRDCLDEIAAAHAWLGSFLDASKETST